MIGIERDTYEADVGSQSSDAIKASFIWCGRRVGKLAVCWPATNSPAKQKDPEGGLCDRGTDYILSAVFVILVDDLDLAIFFLLILSFDLSPFDMLSLSAAGPVEAGHFVSVD